jgi:hypothetical protein
VDGQLIPKLGARSALLHDKDELQKTSLVCFSLLSLV